jgi:hypothetical protein
MASYLRVAREGLVEEEQVTHRLPWEEADVQLWGGGRLGFRSALHGRCFEGLRENVYLHTRSCQPQSKHMPQQMHHSWSVLLDSLPLLHLVEIHS